MSDLQDLYDELDELNMPITNLQTAAVVLCLAINISGGDCSNCPVVLLKYETRTRREKCIGMEPCQTNLYRWLIDEARKCDDRWLVTGVEDGWVSCDKETKKEYLQAKERLENKE